MTKVIKPKPENRSHTIRMATYNVRYDSKPDGIAVKETIDSLSRDIPSPPRRYYPDTKEQPWSTRRIHVANDILWNGVQIFGGQEFLIRQVHDMQELLGSKWSWIGIGRDPEHENSNEYNPIFYRNDLFELESWDTFWLSLTPFRPSKYKTAGSYRICITAHFKSASGPFTMMNTHLDDQDGEQRPIGASLVLYRAKYEAIKSRRPVFVTGDFNSPQSDEAYRITTGQLPPRSIDEGFLRRFSWTADEDDEFQNFTMKDLLGETPPQRRSGNYATFTGWSAPDRFAKFERLDYIFAGSTEGWSVSSYHVGQSLYDDGVYASDHRPVFVDIEVGA